MTETRVTASATPLKPLTEPVDLAQLRGEVGEHHPAYTARAIASKLEDPVQATGTVSRWRGRSGWRRGLGDVPQVGAAVAVRCGQCLAVRAERDRVDDPAAGVGQSGDEVSSGDVP